MASNPPLDAILSVAQMRAAEDRVIATGVSIDALMQRAGKGAAQWVWRMAAGRPVTVLCGPGNNGGDGYVIAEDLRARGLAVFVIAAAAPATAAARNARSLWQGEVLALGSKTPCGVFVDCLFGSGLNRPLAPPHLAELQRLATRNTIRIAIDLPSGVASDDGALLQDGLPSFDLCVALGAWKFAHWLMPAAELARQTRLVPLGIDEPDGVSQCLQRPALTVPDAHSHKYRRGYAAIVGGSMAGAALLSAKAAMRLAGYVALCGAKARGPDALVLRRWVDVVDDDRVGALLIGPGLGRDATARAKLADALAANHRLVLDADALQLTDAAQIAGLPHTAILTPHEGEFAAMFGALSGSKVDRASAAAAASRAVIVLKGADTVIAAPDGRVAVAPPASGWLASAGTGDVLAGLCVAAYAGRAEPFAAACTAVWLHAAAARHCGAGLIADDLIDTIPIAMRECL